MEHSVLFCNQQTETQHITARKCNNVFGPRLYNSLPKYLRDIESVKTEKFKFEIDKFLELIPVEPQIPIYITVEEETASSNSYLIFGLKEFTKVVESLTLPRISLSCFETTPSIQV